MAKIAIISAHFMPEVGYQEVYLARAMSRLGHMVAVFSSTEVSPTSRGLVNGDYPEGVSRDEIYGYTIDRIKPIFSVGATVFVRGLRQRVESYDPDCVLFVGVAKLFASTLLKEGVIFDCKSAAFFGDAAEYIQRTSLRQQVRGRIHDLAFMLLKKRQYLNSVKYLDKVFLNTPETVDFFLNLIPPTLIRTFREKVVPTRLGFDPDDFEFQPAAREAVRAELGLGDQDNALLYMTSTRVMPSKKLEQVIEAVSLLHREGEEIHYAIVGFMGDKYASLLKRFIREQPRPTHFHCYGFLPHSAVARLYAGADAGIWLKAAISIQEAMGTGLPILLERKRVVSHLVDEGVNGWYYESRGDFMNGLRMSVQDLKRNSIDRVDRARHNSAFLSYDVIASEVIDELGVQ